jgi:hypothetical protein
VRDPFRSFVAEIYIEHRDIAADLSDQCERFGHRHRWADHLKPGLRKLLGEIKSEQNVVLHNQHTIAHVEALAGNWVSVSFAIAHDVAQRICVPPAAAQDRLLAPGTRIASCFRAHPARLARLVPQQAIQKQSRRCRKPLPTKQGTNARLHVP